MLARAGFSAPTSPVVSVVIPTRDCLAYLPAALASVEAQGVRGVEVVVVDDGSSDGTGDWLSAKQRTAPWLVVLQGAGAGPNVARNRSIAAARAPLIAFLDADDAWLPGKLSAQLAFHAADPEAAFSFTDYLHVDIGGRSHGTCFEYWPAFRRAAARSATYAGGYRRLANAPARLLAENVVGTSTVMARRDLLQYANGFDVSFRSAEDWDLWLRLARMGPVGFTRTLGTHYLIRRPHSASADARLRIACMRRILSAHAPSVVLDPGGAGAVRRARANILVSEAELARSEGRHLAALAARLGAFWRTLHARLVRGFAGDVVRAVAMCGPERMRASL